ncbi:MAG: GLUG motif-containing protein, partial [Planctomycetota bacterium]
MSGKRISSLLGKITVIVIVGCTLSAQAKYGGGAGEPNDPYLISDANHMQAIGADANDWDKCFKLMADIDVGQFTGEEFNIIGTSHTYPFTGVFDGNGHTVSNFTYNSTGTEHIGLFGYVDDPNAEIKNLGLIDPNVDAELGDFVGSLVGKFNFGSITDCNSVGGSVLGDHYVGGLIGFSDAAVSDSYSTCSVLGDNYVGGLVGYNSNGTVNNSYATGDVNGIWEYVGGLVGYHDGGTVSNSYSTGSVSGNYYIGGLTGFNDAAVSTSYSTGSVLGYYFVGGLVGWNANFGTVSNSYATGSVSGD